ncbi:MAG: acyl-CoA dehydrogenase family protein [Dehalococcoidia bacterium]
MDFSLTEEQDMLKRAARDLLSTHCNTGLVREMEEAGRYAQPLWSQLADLGWLGVGIPEEGGGAGGTVFDQMLVAEEMGRALAPIPYASSSVIAATALAGTGDAAVMKDWLTPIATGARIGTLAVAEPESHWDLDTVSLAATKDGDGYTLSGVKLFVLDGVFADDIIVVARDGAGDDGLVLGIVAPDASGVQVSRMLTIAGDGQAAIRFEGAALPAGRVLARGKVVRTAVEEALNRGRLILAAHMLGAADVAMQMSVDYAQDRVQFGRPIGSFQAIQHKLATMMKELESARALLYTAAWRHALGTGDDVQVAMAKAWMNDTSERTLWEAHQIHAGVAYMMEFDLQLFTRRCKSWELLLGDTHDQRRKVGDHIAATAAAV